MGATHGNKTTAKWNGVSLGEVTSIGDIDMTAETVDVSIYNAVDGFKKNLRGLMEAGEIAIELNFDATDTAGQGAFATDFYAGTTRNLVIEFPAATGASWTIPAIPIGMGTAQPKDDKITMKINVKPDGKPTFAITASAGLTTPFFAMSESAVIAPAPAAATHEADGGYVATVLTGITSVTITPTATAGVITVNGNTVATGEASSAITLGAAGSVTIATIVVTETNKAPKTYTVRITRAAS